MVNHVHSFSVNVATCFHPAFLTVSLLFVHRYAPILLKHLLFAEATSLLRGRYDISFIPFNDKFGI